MPPPNISTYPTISPAALKQHEMALRIRVFSIEPTAKHKHLTVTAEGSIHFELVLSQAMSWYYFCISKNNITANI